MSALWIVVAWVGVSVLCVLFFAVGAALGYRRGWDERGWHAHIPAVQRPRSETRRQGERVPGDRLGVPSR